jgi:phage tail sheath protein FI
MVTFGAPGVYIEEESYRPRSIDGVSTSTSAFVGLTERGPTRPQLVTSPAEYRRWFGGGAGANAYLPYAVRGFFENGGKRLYIARVVSRAATYAEAAFGVYFTVRAVGRGNWGRRIFARIEDASQRPGSFRLRLAYYTTEPAGDPLAWFNSTPQAPVPYLAEDFDNLAPDSAVADYWPKRLADSALAGLVCADAAPADASPERGFRRLSVGGGDGASALDAANYEGSDAPPDREVQGLAALSDPVYREVALVAAPNAPFDVARKVVAHCEAMRFRFAIVDAPPVLPPNFDPRTAIADTSYAALYTPWLIVSDLVDPQRRRTVPASGHVAGIYARVASERGVHKAPANEVVHGALGVTTAVDDHGQEALNPLGINALRNFPGRGLLVWGARTISTDSQWKYVSVRRLIIYLERSIDEGIKWVVFEPNSEAVWNRVVALVQEFLYTVWRSGALLGSTPAEAFFVRCDRSTMTQNDIDNGRLICEIGVAAARPAEFVVIRIGQWTYEADR